MRRIVEPPVEEDVEVSSSVASTSTDLRVTVISSVSVAVPSAEGTGGAAFAMASMMEGPGDTAIALPNIAGVACTASRPRAFLAARLSGGLWRCVSERV